MSAHERKGPEEPQAGRDGRLEERTDDRLAARKEFLQVFKRGAEFTEELLKENERLRYRIASLQAPVPAGDDGLVKELLAKVSRLEEEREQLRRRFSEVEAENRDFASRYVEIETENSNLLSIYVASYQLHSTLDFDEVLQIITEIILNFVGAEIFGIALLDEQRNVLHPLVAEGIPKETLGRIDAEGEVIRQVVETGEPWFVPDIAHAEAPGRPAVCIPLTIKQRTIGVIVIYKFLEHKDSLAKLDHELFSLLAGHAATAVFSAKVYTDSQRKLNTLQGLIDLVTS